MAMAVALSFLPWSALADSLCLPRLRPHPQRPARDATLAASPPRRSMVRSTAIQARRRSVASTCGSPFRSKLHGTRTPDSPSPSTGRRRVLFSRRHAASFL